MNERLTAYDFSRDLFDAAIALAGIFREAYARAEVTAQCADGVFSYMAVQAKALQHDADRLELTDEANEYRRLHSMFSALESAAAAAHHTSADDAPEDTGEMDW